MADVYSFHDLIVMTRKVITAFQDVEQRAWTIETTMMERTKQVGDLARRILVQERYYLADRDDRPEYHTTVVDIGDELADILYCVIRVAEYYHIDLEAAHIQARRNEMRYTGREPDF